MAPAECQMLPSAQGGYVLRFTRVGAAAPGCETATPAETSDIWIFDTLAESESGAHAALSMPYTGNEPDPLPAGLIGAGRFTQREVDSAGHCNIDSFTAMFDVQWSLLRDAGTSRRWEARQPRTRSSRPR